MGGPSGTVSFLFTDVEGSTRLWEDAPGAMRIALERHDTLVRRAIVEHGGYVFATGGDGFAAAFARAADAVRAAIDAQLSLLAEQWPDGAAIRVRSAVHTGEVTERDGDYFGGVVNRAARLMAVAHGGQVLCSSTTAGLLRDGVTLLDLGEHRLRDLSAPQRVFQVVHAGLPEGFPPLSSLDSYPGNLPLATTRFVGRGDALRDVANSLEEFRLVTVTGVGGVGKTRLAMQVAGELLPGYPDGVWLVELGGVGDPAAVDETVAKALRVQSRPSQPLASSLLDFLRVRQLLLVIDNCEHLVAPVAALLERVLGACPRIRVLATSREGLAVAGERVIPVAPMELPSEETFEAASQCDAVRLFVERVADVRPGFALAENNAATVSRLCRRLDGIPLALELAAARLRSMSPVDILTHLDQRFRLLTGGRRTALSRQHTLRGAIDWSYDLLDESERAALRRLTVFAGGFDLEAAESVIAFGSVAPADVADLVDRLVDKSLVVADLTGSTARSRLLEMIRDYGWERLVEAGEAEAASHRHTEHFHAMARAADDGLRGPDEVEWTARIERELDNLRGAVAWATEADQADLALGIIAALAPAFSSRIGAPFGPIAERAASAPSAVGHPLRSVALASAARSALDLGDPRGARALADAALAESELAGSGGLGYQNLLARARCRVLSACAIVFAPGDMQRVVELARLRLEAATRSGDPWERSMALTLIVGTNPDDPGAVAAGEEAIRLAREVGTPSGLGFALMGTAPALASTRPDQAKSMLAEAIRIATETDNSFARVHAHQSLGRVHAASGDLVEAARSFRLSAGLASECGDRLSVFANVGEIAVDLAEGGDTDTAVLLGTWAAQRGGWPEEWAAIMLTGLEHSNRLVERLRALAGEDREQLSRQIESMDDNDALAAADAAISRLAESR